MNNMKKTTLAVAVAISLGTGAAQAACVDPNPSSQIMNFAFHGTFTMYTPTGTVWGGDPNVTGSMTLDMNTGSGSASIAPSTPFSGYLWTAHNIALQAIAPNTVQANMLFDWNGNLNIPVTVDFSMTPVVGGYTYSIATLDGNGDGIPGYPMVSGPFPDWNATFGGMATTGFIYDPPLLCPVTVPAWLFGSGLAGLVGIRRRKQADS